MCIAHAPLHFNVQRSGAPVHVAIYPPWWFVSTMYSSSPELSEFRVEIFAPSKRAGGSPDAANLNCIPDNTLFNLSRCFHVVARWESSGRDRFDMGQALGLPRWSVFGGFVGRYDGTSDPGFIVVGFMHS